MPGEQLTCVWQAIYSLDSPTSVHINKEILQLFLKNASIYESITFSERKFCDTFSEPNVKFYDFKEYVRKHLRENGVTYSKTCSDLEEMSWNNIKSRVNSKLEVEDVYKLWCISNRLVKEDTYPPVIYLEEANWLLDKILSYLGQNLKSSDDAFRKDKLTFQEMLFIMEDTTFSYTSKQKIQTCIDDLFMWLVEEVMKKGKVYKRTKKQANWTHWVKRCCILTPQCIRSYGTDAIVATSVSATGGSKQKGEFTITKNTKLESLKGYSGELRYLEGRAMEIYPFFAVWFLTAIRALPCENNQVKCATGVCINNNDVCDGIRHCLDGSDEEGESCKAYACPESKRKCTDNQQCLDKQSLCDGYEDCNDKSDEDSVFCRVALISIKSVLMDYKCISKYSLCDGREDCTDRSDEELEVCRLWKCDSDQVKCNDGIQCIFKSSVCNKDTDCKDTSDEDENMCKGEKIL
ncbi:LRP2 [Mytilus edulis]|uniref:LRP2 n=1 Tax=Mytilus edulis TaxID=6550 RepID=A0A8S3V7T3_MYTED|nr:LRP2 [Mytilus edulis]